jgi:hypothetical protein
MMRLAGPTPCDVQIAAVMVSAADGNLLRNASSLSVRSCFDSTSHSFESLPDLMLIYGLVVVLLMLLNLTNFYQIITFRLMLRRTRCKPGCCHTFFQLEARKFLSALLIVSSCLSIAFLLPVQNQGRKQKDSAVFYIQRLVIAAISFILLVTIASVTLQKLKACSSRRKLHHIAHYKCSSSSAPQSHFLEHVSPADGNCLFHALAAAVRDCSNQPRAGCASDATHDVIRRDIIDYLRAHGTHLSVGNTGVRLRDYVQAETKGVFFDR